MYLTIRTSAREVRAVFNTYVLPGVLSGQFFELVLPPGRPSASSHQPAGTLSQFVLYMDGGNVVAEAHRFLLPDGEIGASGLPDPKGVLFEGQWLVPDERSSLG